MDAERAREFLLTLPHVCETKQWGENLVFWTGDKVIGGKMFCLLNLDPGGGGVVSASQPGRSATMSCWRSMAHPAPYMARIFWVAAEGWSALRNAEWEELLRAAHELVFAKLPRTRAVLEMPVRAREKLILERRTLMKKRAAAEKASKSAKKAAKTNR